MEEKNYAMKKDITCIKVEGVWYALNGWDGYKYTDCWEVDEYGYTVEKGKTAEIIPIYEEITEDEWELIKYEKV